MASITEILDFWFGAPGSETAGKRRKEWFQKDAAFDQEICSGFLSTYEQAAAGQLDTWQETPRGALALVLLFDQFPRNMFRGTPQAFATDSQALAVAQQAIAVGLDQQLPPLQRQFFYFPLEHSESLEHQRQAVQLFARIKNDPETADSYPYALRHCEIIERFGRFPHRNAILGRKTTPEEAEFLQQPGSSF
jgi:uncharacterized protein (DUF924 family)